MSRVVQYLLADLAAGHRQVVVLHAWALIHIDDTNLKLLREEVDGLLVLREDRGADAVLRRVDQLQRLLFILNLLESDYGTKKLLTLYSHPVICIGDYCGLKKPALSMLISVGIPADAYEPAHVN